MDLIKKLSVKRAIKKKISHLNHLFIKLITRSHSVGLRSWDVH